MLITRYKKLSGLFALFAVAYVAISLFIPPDKATLIKYNLSLSSYILVILAIVIPYLALWSVAYIGYLRFRSYTDTIRGSKDGAAFHAISNGLLWLAFWMPISAVFSAAATGYYKTHHSATPVLTILNNFLNLILLLAIFIMINRGSNKLLGLIRKPPLALPKTMVVLYVIVATLYTFMVLSDPARQFPTHKVPVATNYMPDWLTIVTIVIPRLITWFFGLEAIHNIYMYRKQVKGQIYKHALNNLATGLAWLITSFIVLRAFQTLSTLLTSLPLGLLLLIIYLLFALLSVGYILIARGSKRLQLIEEI